MRKRSKRFLAWGRRILEVPVETWLKRILAGLLILLFIVLAGMVIYLSWIIIRETLGLLARSGSLNTEDSIKLYLQVYSGVVKETLNTLLNPLVIAFVAYVTGKTVSVVSYNATKVRSPGSEPQTLRIFD